MSSIRSAVQTAVPNLAEAELGRAFGLYIHEVKGKRQTNSGKRALVEARIALQTATMDLYMRGVAGEEVGHLREKQTWLAKRLIG